jgi:hypothetical protein
VSDAEPGRQPSPPEPDASALVAALAQAKRDEEWALVVVLSWIALLLFIVFVLVVSPVPWGALLGLVVWSLGVRNVYSGFTATVARTRELKRRVAALERAPGDAGPE